jgi:hypothetical protein
MAKKVFRVAAYLSICAVALLFCANPQNPFSNSANAKMSLIFMDSRGHAGADLAVSDTVGDSVKIGVCPYLSGFIDSVTVTIFKYRNNTDSTYVLKNFSSDVDTQWSTFTFATVGKWDVSAKAVIQGGRLYTLPGEIKIFGKNVSATIQPASETRAVDSIAAFTVSSNADTPFTCQWYHETAAIAGETGVSFIKSHIAFSDSGKYTCAIVDKWGDTGITAIAAILTVVPKVRTNTIPTISVGGHSTILSTEICSLTVSAIDPDSGQTHEFAVTRAPAGYSFAGHLFTWAPPAAYLGQDTIRTDTAVFTVTDNGVPPLSDTQKVAIVVSVKIPPPDSVRGLIAVSRANGSFVFKWNKSKNADQYAIYRSRDTAGFVLYTTTPDTEFANAIGDTSFYYYVVATNSKGMSPASQRVRSTTINTAPKWSHDMISISINEGSSFSFNCVDSCKDTNGDAISFSLLLGGPTTDSLIGTIWKYTPGYSDSGSYTVKIKAWDGMDSSILTIALHVVNVPRPPQPQPQILSTKRNTALPITLSAVSPDGDSITSWVIDIATKHGTSALSVNAGTATVVYKPDSVYIGNDYFTFKVSVGSLSSTYSAKVSIRIDTNNIAPAISQKLSAQTHNKGDSLTLTIAINQNAFPAPWYFWYKAGTLLDSTQVNFWKKTNLALADSGYYYVITRNVAGHDSSGATLTMQSAPVISQKLPAFTTVNAASETPISVTVNADATPVPTYQWYFNGQSIRNATSNSYSKTWTIADTGGYKIMVSNAAGKDSSTTTLIVSPPPNPPALVSPADGATSQPVSLALVWNKIAIAASYFIQIAPDTGFGTTIASDSTLTDTTKPVTGLSNGITYYWRVRAKNAVGASPWSARRRFTTAPLPPSAPQLVSPVGDSTNIFVDTSLAWKKASGALSYDVQVSTNNLFGPKIFDFTGISDTFKAIAGLSTVTKYYWRASAVNTGGISGWTADSFITGLNFSADDNNLTSNSIKAIVANGATVIAGTSVGIFQSTDSGASWNLVNYGYVNSANNLSASGGIVFAGTADGVFRSLDNGSTWLPVNNGLTDSLSVQAIAIKNGNVLNVFAGTYNGVYRSSDTGKSWTNVSGGIDTTSLDVYALAVCNGYLLAGTSNDILISANNGQKWTPSQTLNGYTVSSLGVSGDTVFSGALGANSGLYSCSIQQMYFSQSTSWKSGVPTSFAIGGNTIFACTGTNSKVWTSLDNGATWFSVTNSSVTSLTVALAVGGHYLYNGTTSGGMFRSSLP